MGHYRQALTEHIECCSLQYLASLKWSTPKVNGKVPNARDGHSACVIDGKMYIFGGYEEQVRDTIQFNKSSNFDLLHENQ